MWQPYSDLPSNFGITAITFSGGLLKVKIVSEDAHQFSFQEFCTYRVSFESDIHLSMPKYIPASASFTKESTYIKEFMKICDPARLPSGLIHSIVMDFSIVVEILSEEFPKFEPMR